MPVPIAYPSTLPSPAAAGIQSLERRVTSAMPFEARALQRDRLARQEITFPPMTATEADAFEKWWRETLIYGGAWFSSNWPLPQGMVAGVRRFLQPPNRRYVAPHRWQLSAPFEVRGRGLPPQRYPAPLLAMHFDGNFTDLSGYEIAPRHWTSGDAPPTFSSTAPKFPGTQYVVNASFGQPMLSENRGNLNLGQYGEWQVSFWMRATDSGYGYKGGHILSLQGNSQTGSSPGAGARHGQIFVRANDTGGSGQVKLSVIYPSSTLNLAGGPDYGFGSLKNPADHGDGISIPNDVWSFVAICGDAVSTRAYINSTLALDDSTVDFPAGTYPLFYDPDRPFVSQFFIVGQAHSGYLGSDPGPPLGGSDAWYDVHWPGSPLGTSFSSGFSGGLCDLLVKSGPGAVDYHGSTITPPTAPFTDGS